MRRWLKLTLWSAGLLAVAGVGVGAAEYVLVRRTPDWYTAGTGTPEQQASARQKVEDTLVRLYDWSGGHHARQAGRGRVATPVVADRADDAPFPLSFTDGQLNAFYDKWSGFQNRRATADKYVQDPRVIVQDGHLIVAGQVKEMGGVVVSLFLDPSVSPADGRVRLTLAKVMAGVIQVPDSFTANQRASLERVLTNSLPADQARAALTPDGLANGPAATAAMAEMLLGVLRGRETEPVLFVPTNANTSSSLLPVRITAVSAADHTLAMTARAVPADDRRALLEQIKRPDDPSPPKAAATP